MFGIDMIDVIADALLEEPAILLYSVGQDCVRLGKEAMKMLVGALVR